MAYFVSKNQFNKYYPITELQQILSGNLDSVQNFCNLSRILDGPSYVEMCESCQMNRSSLTDTKSSKTRLVIMDCRVGML